MNHSLRAFTVGTLILHLCTAGALAAEPTKQERLVSVNGQGKISAVPDQARLRIEVTEDGPRVDAVNQQVRKKMDDVIKVVKNQGIPEKDIQTQAFQVVPKMEWKSGRSSRIGYTVSNQILVTVRDLKKTGAVLSAVLDAGANNVFGPDFGFQDSKALERKALTLALEDAKAKAALLAEAAGASLGPVMIIQEGAVHTPGPRPMYARAQMAAMEKTAEEPIAAGEETVQATVNASFSLK